MNDRYFRALGWVGYGLAILFERVERVAGWLRDECAMARSVTSPYRRRKT